MRAIIFTILFLIHLFIPLKSNDFAETNIKKNLALLDNQAKLGRLYEDKGHVMKSISDNEIIHLKVKVYKKELNSQTQRSFKSYVDERRFGYTIIGISESTFNDQLTSTWLFGFWVKVNGVQITQPLYPRGKEIMVYTTPTELYYFETEEPSVLVKVGWVDSIYEPKIIK